MNNSLNIFKKLNHKRTNYNYTKPSNYYNHLLTFFAIISLTLTFSLVKFEIESIEIFFLKFIIIIFLLLFISVLIEFFYRSEYMNPIEIFKVENFSNKFLKSISKNKDYEKYFNKYDTKSKKKINKIFDKKSNFYLSSIRKHKKIYEVTIINEKNLLVFLISRFFGRTGVHKLFLENQGKKFKIIRFN